MGFREEMRELGHYRNAYLLALSASMGSIFYGWDIGLIGGVISMASFKESFGFDKKTPTQVADLNGNVVSILQGGCFFGALSMAYFSARFGRKACLLVSGIIYIIGSVIQSIVALGDGGPDVALSVLYFGRFVGGWGVGMVSALVPSYVSECVPKAIRGRCTGMIQLANNVGIMLSFWVNYSTEKDIPYGHMQWRIPFIVQIIPGFLFIIAMFFQPESPRWLVEHGQHDKAAKTLAFVARTTPSDPAVIATLEEIKMDFAGRETLSIWTQVKKMGESGSIAFRCFIPSLVMFCQQWTGTNSINYFSPQIFQSLGLTGSSAGLFATGIYGVVKVVSVSIVLFFAVESLGRKKCLIVGGIGQGLMMLWIAGYMSIHPGNDIVPASYVSIVAVYLYAVFYCVGWGPVPWVVAGEVSPNHLRTVVMSLAIGVNWLFSFTISKITPIMLSEIKYGTFLVFGIMCFLMSVWTYFCLPETKGYALEDIKYLFEGGTKQVLIRSLGDAPGGRLFIGKKRAEPVEDMRRRDEEQQAAGGSTKPANATDSQRASSDGDDVHMKDDPAKRPII